MIARVAKNIHEAQQIAMERASQTGVLNQRELDEVAARAAIEAMREPTEAMLFVGRCQIDDCSERNCSNGARHSWEQMIDASLK